MNPCPCGYHGDPGRRLPLRVAPPRGLPHAGISGPLLDRFDLLVEVPRADAHGAPGEPSAAGRRAGGAGPLLLAERPPALTPEAEALLGQAVERSMLSARGRARALRVARSIAALEGGGGADGDPRGRGALVPHGAAAMSGEVVVRRGARRLSPAPARAARPAGRPCTASAGASCSTWPGPVLAAVGSRTAGEPGLALARRLCRAAAAAGALVVSGLALGIDAAAHEGALDAAEPTVAVLGCGADVAYPPRNRALHGRVIEQGLVVSEYPAGTEPAPWRFPARNRLIAALADVVLVVEARRRSGALITADHALDLGRDVLAVPGWPGFEGAAGTNALLKAGAGLIEDEADLLGWLGLEAGGARPCRAARSPDRRGCSTPCAAGRPIPTSWRPCWRWMPAPCRPRSPGSSWPALIVRDEAGSLGTACEARPRRAPSHVARAPEGVKSPVGVATHCDRRTREAL